MPTISLLDWMLKIVPFHAQKVPRSMKKTQQKIVNFKGARGTSTFREERVDFGLKPIIMPIDVKHILFGMSRGHLNAWRPGEDRASTLFDSILVEHPNFCEVKSHPMLEICLG